MLKTRLDVGHHMPFQQEWQGKALRFDLQPGDAVYFPPTAPHWVQNGDDVSVSFSITFRSEAGDRRQRVYWVNHRLRSLGLSAVSRTGCAVTVTPRSLPRWDRQALVRS